MITEKFPTFIRALMVLLVDGKLNLKHYFSDEFSNLLHFSGIGYVKIMPGKKYPFISIQARTNFNSQMNNFQRFLLAIAAFLVFNACQSIALSAEPTSDSRGYINVFQFRKNLSQVEPYITSEDTDSCFREGYPDEDERPLKALEKQRRNQQEKKERVAEKLCVAAIQKRYADYRRRQDAFNASWMPKIKNAIRKGDKVAEVILIRCDTTPVLDRANVATTCSSDPSIRKQAVNRLREIGFVPAIPVEDEPGYCEFQGCGSPSGKGREILQGILLNAFKHGNFGPFRYEANGYWDVDNDEALNYRLARNKALIDAARQEISRVFLFDSDLHDEFPEFKNLTISRSVRRPQLLAWGPELIINGQRWTKDHWRTLPFRPNLCKGIHPNRICKGVAFGRSSPYLLYRPDVIDLDFEKDLNELLSKASENIDNYLAQDGRWAIFLAKRIGHHEWVPVGLQTDSNKLDRSWLGRWKLEKRYEGFSQAASVEGEAEIVLDGESTRISIKTSTKESAPIRDVNHCMLRYSGGLTPYSELGSSISTTIGDLGRLGVEGSIDRLNKDRHWKNQDGLINGLEPFDPKKRYKQVLMQCAEAEMPDNDRVRFLLLAGDTLVEIATDSPVNAPLYIRQFKRMTEK